MARNLQKEKQDKLGESAIHDFLVKYFYPIAKDLIEVNDKETQLLGVDTKFSINGFNYLCDEKAALDYTNGQKGYKLTTFCLELSFLGRDDVLREGWLTKDTLLTNSYLLVWVDKSDYDIISDADEIEEAEIVLVRKQDILDYLKSIGWDKDKLRIKCNNIRNNNDRNLGDYRINGCKFSYAEYLPEKPINILLKREVYKNMPNTIYKKYIRAKV